MNGPKRIWAWPWEVNPQMGQWTADQQIVGEGAEYVHIDEVNAIIAAADRRAEMHECAMEERDDCIEDWSKANDQICRLTAELDAMRAALKPLTVQDAARVLLSDPDAVAKLARAYDREDSAQRGEADPHDGRLFPTDPEWEGERIACATAALRAIAEGRA